MMPPADPGVVMIHPSPRIVALGQRFAGDDAAGLAVADHLRAAGLPVLEVTSAVDLVSALDPPGDVILVDAVRGDAPGRVVELDPEALAGGGLAAVSSHGLDVPAAIALAAVLHGPSRVRVVGIVIGPAPRFTEGLSAEVAAAVPLAAAAVRRLCPG
jgi:hydrogenase maturation protease